MFFGSTINNVLHRIVDQPVKNILYNCHNNCIDNFWRYVFYEYRFFVAYNKDIHNHAPSIDSCIIFNPRYNHSYYNIVMVNSIDQYKTYIKNNALCLISIDSPDSPILETSIPSRHINICYHHNTLEKLKRVSNTNILINPCIPDTIKSMGLNSNVYKDKSIDLCIVVGNAEYDTVVQIVEVIKKQIKSINIEILNNFETQYLHETLMKSRCVFWMEDYCDFNALYATLYGCRSISTNNSLDNNKNILYATVDNIGDLVQSLEDYDYTNLEKDTSAFRNSLYIDSSFIQIQQQVLNLMETII